MCSQVPVKVNLKTNQNEPRTLEIKPLNIGSNYGGNLDSYY